MTEEEKFMAMMQAKLDKQMEQMNTTPNPEMDNLSPDDMYQILYHTFEEASPVGFKPDITPEVFDSVPFFQLVKAYMNILNKAGELKLTQKGNLPRKICIELYEMGFIKEHILEAEWGRKLSKEADSMTLVNTKHISDFAGITKKRNGKVSLTAKGKKLLDSDKSEQLFKEIFTANLVKFNMGYHDGHPHEAQVQQVFGYTLYLLLRYGTDSRVLNFYVEKKLRAFPQLLEDFFEARYSTPEDRFSSCYWIRIFERFLVYYELVEYEKIEYLSNKDTTTLKTTPVFHQIFELKPQNFRFRTSQHQA